MDVDVVSKRIQIAAENERGVHKRAWVHQFSLLTDLHLLYVEDEAAIEDLEGERALSAEYEDLVVGNLVSETHVARNPVRFVTVGSLNFLPHVLRDIVALDSVDDLFLVNSSSKGKYEVVLEAAESDTRSCHSQAVDLLPLVFSNVVNLAVAVNKAVDECSDDVDEAFERAKRVVRVRINHTGLLIKHAKYLVVSVALLEILVSSLVAAADEVDATILGRN